LAYCKVLSEHHVHESLAKILLPAIKKGANLSLLKSIRVLPISHASELLSAAQKHLHSEPHNALWLAMVAHFAVFDQQWPLAEKAFNTLVNLEGEQYDNVDLLVFANVLEHQQQLAKANQVLRKIHA
jgi:HemY protein